MHAVNCGGQAINLHCPHIGNGRVTEHFRLIVHVTSDLSRNLSGVSDIELPDFPVHSVQKQRSGVVSGKVSGLSESGLTRHTCSSIRWGGMSYGAHDSVSTSYNIRRALFRLCAVRRTGPFSHTGAAGALRRAGTAVQSVGEADSICQFT